ncbi:phage tail protein [Psychrobacter pygoscelis]|uniref:phage tail protein n=1 Tax=Psychrobacter pygoscelis TaxID=2488563 RepID=UPI00103DF46E|nr:hypothetical protein [Psychrobacter pygoscelis]
MHRIDSATARADVNGEGKNGFHDNADLPNQDATYFTPEWANALQEEIAGAIEGLGIDLDKSDNGQLLKALVKQFGEKKVLEDAVEEYKEMIKKDRVRIKKLENRTYEDTQIGEVFWTTEHFVTAAEVTEYKGYGEWSRALQGRVAVGFSDIPDDPINFRTHGAKYGEHEHTLTIEEMPEHKHAYMAAHEGGSGRIPDENGHISINQDGSGGSVYIKHEADEKDGSVMTKTGGNSLFSNGGSLPHNNQQPSQTIDCWERIA